MTDHIKNIGEIVRYGHTDSNLIFDIFQLYCQDLIESGQLDNEPIKEFAYSDHPSNTAIGQIVLKYRFNRSNEWINRLKVFFE